MGKSFWPGDTLITNGVGGNFPTGAWGTSFIENSTTDFTMWFDATTGPYTHYASSTDGIAWTDNGSITVSGSLPTGTTTVGHAVILRTNADTLHPYEMWYYTGLTTEGITQLAHATSVDGITWGSFASATQSGTSPLVTGHSGSAGWNNGIEGPTCMIYNPGGSSTLDTTTAFNNKYVMYYLAYNKNSHVDATGLAISTDGINWTRFGAGATFAASGAGWDGAQAVIWYVFQEGGEYKAFYSAGALPSGTSVPWQGIGYATSTDGYTWARDPADATHNPIFKTTDGVSYRDDRVWVPRIMYVTNSTDKWYRMYFTVRNTAGAGSVAYTDGPHSAIPEPGTLGLLGLGLGALILKRRRKAA